MLVDLPDTHDVGAQPASIRGDLVRLTGIQVLVNYTPRPKGWECDFRTADVLSNVRGSRRCASLQAVCFVYPPR